VAAREGFVMLLLGRSQEALDNLVAEFRSSAVEAHAFSVDIAGVDAGQLVENKLAEIGVYCDVLVNSAGFGVFGAAAETNREEHLKLIDVNIRALTDLTLRFLTGMIGRRRGGVLNVGSITEYTPGPNMAMHRRPT
jgi:short-subunit dehydrogenase